MSHVTKANPLPPIFIQKPLLAAKQGAHVKSFEDLVPVAAPSSPPSKAEDEGGHIVDIVI